MHVEIFITDDDPAFSSILEQALGKQGFSYWLCKNEDEFIEAFGLSNEPALVFLDIFMDDGDGFSIMKKLRSFERSFLLRFVTGSNKETEHAARVIAKAYGFRLGETLFKPFALDQFHKAVADDVRQISA